MAHFNLIYYSVFFIFLEFMTTFFFSSWERKQKLPLPHPIVYVAFNLVQSLVETCLAFPILTVGFSYGTDMRPRFYQLDTNARVYFGSELNEETGRRGSIYIVEMSGCRGSWLPGCSEVKVPYWVSCEVG